MSKKKKNLTKILYLYDFEGWALHNVGRLWLDDVNNIKVRFIQFKKFKKKDFYEYDLIWFGNYDIFLYHYSHLTIKIKNLNKCIISVHDPLELYPQQENWKDIETNLKKWWDISFLRRWSKLNILKKVKYIVTASNEMQIMMKKSGIESYVIPTMSMLPLKNKKSLSTKKCNTLSIYEVYPRKNIILMNKLQVYCKNTLNLNFDTKVGKKMLSTEQYIKLLDDHAVYICTSYQEGGPIPAMDAMQRGSIVLSTPVGQVQDLIIDGFNGYICNSEEEFKSKLRFIAKDLKLLQKMRLNSLDYIKNKRTDKKIRSRSAKLIESIKVNNDSSNTQDLNSISNITLAVSYFLINSIFRIFLKYKLMIT